MSFIPSVNKPLKLIYFMSEANAPQDPLTTEPPVVEAPTPPLIRRPYQRIVKKTPPPVTAPPVEQTVSTEPPEPTFTIQPFTPEPEPEPKPSKKREREEKPSIKTWSPPPAKKSKLSSYQVDEDDDDTPFWKKHIIQNPMVKNAVSSGLSTMWWGIGVVSLVLFRSWVQRMALPAAPPKPILGYQPPPQPSPLPAQVMGPTQAPAPVYAPPTSDSINFVSHALIN